MIYYKLMQGYVCFQSKIFGNFCKQSSDTDLVAGIVSCEFGLYSITIYLQRIQIFELVTMIYVNCIVVDVPSFHLEFHGTNTSTNHSKLALHKTDLNWNANTVVCQKTPKKTKNKATESLIRFSKP